MPFLELGRKVGGVDLAPHFSTLVFPTDRFETNTDPHIRFRQQTGPELGIILLRGSQIRFHSAERQPFSANEMALSKEILANGPSNSDELRSLAWIPRIEELLAGAGTLGRPGSLLFSPNSGLPVAGNIAAHVLLDTGSLVTHTVFPVAAGQQEGRPNIFGFRVDAGTELVTTQATACAVALELSDLHSPLEIRIAGAGGVLTLTLRPPSSGDVEIELSNRELEETFRLAIGEISEGDVDRDFKVLYFLSGNEGKNCPLPFLLRAASSIGVGTRRTTCGGARFEGFANGLADLVAAVTSQNH
jgi:hypothetical protein